MALNSLSYLEAYHAAFLGRGVINPLNLRLAAKELAYILADSGTRVCFVDAMVRGPDRLGARRDRNREGGAHR